MLQITFVLKFLCAMSLIWYIDKPANDGQLVIEGLTLWGNETVSKVGPAFYIQPSMFEGSDFSTFLLIFAVLIFILL
jgi:hypothetical protein